MKKSILRAWLLIILCGVMLTTSAHAHAHAKALSNHTGTTAPLSMTDMVRQVTKQSAAIHRIVSLPDSRILIPSPMQTIEAYPTPDGLTVASTNASKPGRFSMSTRTLGRIFGKRHAVQQGTVFAQKELVRIVHPELTEELTTGTEGIRQDFLIPTSPPGHGELFLELSFTGATLYASGNNIGIKLPEGRTLVYHRLLVSDSSGRTFPARFELIDSNGLRIVVADADATYPLRIDPVITDTNWISIVQPDTDLGVTALVCLGTDLYAGGSFTAIGGVPANRIAKWDGNDWSTLGSGMDGAVKAIVSDGTNIYVGGSFTTAGGVPANRIAKWDGNAWSTLGSGMDGTVVTVSALAWDGSTLYAGGSFTTAGGVSVSNIAKWNGNAWLALASGVNGSVLALAWDGSTLYAGGTFTSAGGGGADTASIAKWNGSVWSPLSSGVTGAVKTVYALAWDGFVLYAGGAFSGAGGVPNTGHIAKWNGSAWSALDGGIDSYVYSLTLDDGNNLYVGGGFTSAGGVVNIGNIAKWNGSAWSALDIGTNGDVFALAWGGNTLYAGGGFISAGGVVASRIARWDGNHWSPLGSGMNGAVNAMLYDGNNIYVGGSFTAVSGVSANYIAKWDGNTWSALGSGINGEFRKPVYVSALAWDGSNLYVGGSFTTAGEVNANRIARWDGNAWSALGSGISYPENNNASVYVTALAWDGNNLYAGGRFTTAGGMSASRIARWDGNAWFALGSGADNDVLALAWGGGDLYVGGKFSSAGGAAGTGYIAKWDGNTWSPIGGGTTSFVYALAWDGNNLYAGGIFTFVYNGMIPLPVNRIAKWNGSTWSTLGTGVSGPVNPTQVSSLAWDGSNLYAGGNFTAAGGGGANRIARWDGSAWSALGSGMDAEVNALSLAGHLLYAGGALTTAGGSPARAAYFKVILTVTFNSNGGSAVADQVIFYSGTSTEPAAPGREGFVFAGWYADAGLTILFDFATPVKMDTTLYARWTPITCTLTITMDGTGSVLSDPAGLNCSTNCTRDYDGGSTFTLYATTSGDTTFAGWSGGYCSGFAPCPVAMTQNRSIVASFGPGPPLAMIDLTGFDSIVHAYSGAVSDDIILARDGDHTIGTLTLNLGSDITIKGGYDSTFLVPGQPTLMLGVLVISTGSLTLDNVIISSRP